MTIAVDFDGTIVEHEYPKIGKEIPFAIDTLKMLIKDRHKLILWSVREGAENIWKMRCRKSVMSILKKPLNGVKIEGLNFMQRTRIIQKRPEKAILYTVAN